MSTETPRTPAPHVVKSGGINRLVPAAEAYNISPEILAAYQASALSYIDDVRERILEGEILGVAFANVVAEDGDLCISTGWSDGFGGYGITGLAAISALSHRFNDSFQRGD